MTDRPPLPVNTSGTHGRARAALIATRGGKLAVAVLSLLVLASTGYGWRAYTNLNEGIARTDVSVGGPPGAKPLDGAVDILLVGKDSRTDAQGNPLPQEVLDRLHLGEASGEKQTDTMILVHIPQDGKSAVAFSFPRDSYVRIAGGYGKHKLNSAYVYAYNDTFQSLRQKGAAGLDEIRQQAKTAGRKNLIATIEELIGRPNMIDRYAEVNLASFYHITKALGGIKVCLNGPVHEPKSGVDLPGGVQTIKGVQALGFVRQRYGLDDGGLDRIRRQQAFLSGVAREVLSADVLLNPAKQSELISAIQKSVVLSENWDLREFAAQMRALSGGKIKFHTIPTEGNATIGGAAVLPVDTGRVRSFVDRLIGEAPSSGGVSPGGDDGQTRRAEQITVDIYNGSGAPDLGREVRGSLQDKGFQGNSYATIGIRSTSVVRYPPGERDNAEVLRQALGAELRTQADSDVPTGHLRLLLGSGFEQAASDGSASPSTSRQRTSPSAGSDSPPTSRASEDDPITAGGVPCVD